ncbi:MAG: bile acid:sodium symporter family protein [Cyclobacteriaceae bacterium]|nr:bile acid:sodium symporter family protein [Cyclobacteriaceae bacterium]
MQANILTEIFLPLGLGIIMLGMGLSLSLTDFKRLIDFPRATFIGLIAQLVLLPLIAFGLLHFFDLPPELAAGVMLIAFCPGGPTSNLLSNMARADLALSITLTALSSMITVFTIPILMNLAMEYFMGEGRYVQLPVVKTMLQILVITIIPVSIGMAVRKRFSSLASRMENPFKIASAIFMVIIIAGVFYNERDNIADFFAQVGTITLMLNIIILAIAYGVAKVSRLSHPQSATISIESGIQNGTLAIAIASGSMLLNNPQMAIAPAIYSLIMFFTGFVVVYIYSRRFMFDQEFV